VSNHDATLDPKKGVYNRGDYDGASVYPRNGPAGAATLNRESSLPAINQGSNMRQRNPGDLLGSPARAGNKYYEDNISHKYSNRDQRNNFGQVHN